MNTEPDLTTIRVRMKSTANGTKFIERDIDLSHFYDDNDGTYIDDSYIQLAILEDWVEGRAKPQHEDTTLTLIEWAVY